MLQLTEGIINIIAIAIIIPQHTLFQTQLVLTSEVTKAGRMMQGTKSSGQLLNSSKWPKPRFPGCWPSTWSTTENRAAGHLRETMATGQAELLHLNYMAHAP